MSDTIARPFGTLSGCFYAAHGVYMVIAGLVLAVFCWLIPKLLVNITSSEVVDEKSLPAAARAVLEHREFMPLLALPVIIIGLIILNKVPPRWLWLVLGFIAMLLPAALLIYTFIVAIGTLYMGQSL